MRTALAFGITGSPTIPVVLFTVARRALVANMATSGLAAIPTHTSNHTSTNTNSMYLRRCCGLENAKIGPISGTEKIPLICDKHDKGITRCTLSNRPVPLGHSPLWGSAVGNQDDAGQSTPYDPL